MFLFMPIKQFEIKIEIERDRERQRERSYSLFVSCNKLLCKQTETALGNFCLAGKIHRRNIHKKY